MQHVLTICICMALTLWLAGVLFLKTPAYGNSDCLAWHQLSVRGTRAMKQQRYDYAEMCFWASIQSLSPYPSSAFKDYELYHSYSQLAVIYNMRDNPVDELRCQLAANWHLFWGYMVAVAPMQLADDLPIILAVLVSLQMISAAVVAQRRNIGRDRISRRADMKSVRSGVLQQHPE